MASLPAAPTRSYSFTSNSTNAPTSQQPGVSLDANYDLTNAAVGQIITFLRVSINADGSLNTAAVQKAYDAGSGNDGNEVNVADAPSALSAVLSQAWAEYLDNANGEIPADTLAIAGITGNHWSARWWAAQAATTVETQSLEVNYALQGLAVVQAEVATALNQSGGAEAFALESLGIATANTIIAEQAYAAANAAIQAANAYEAQVNEFNAIFDNDFLNNFQLYAMTLPTSPSLASGDFWNNSGLICFAPNSRNAALFPTTPPTPGSKILWNDGGVLCAA